MKQILTFLACLVVSVAAVAQQRIMTVTKSDNQQQTFVVNEVDEVTFSTLGEHECVFNGHVYVDLGLSVMWATCNVGATSSEDYGDYFQWGETEPHNYETEHYDWANYKYGKAYDRLEKYCYKSNYGKDGYTDALNVLVPGDDAAAANWGGAWRMPTKSEWNELFNNSELELDWIEGQGCQITSKIEGHEGAVLFLPAAGYRYDSYRNSDGWDGYYWSSSLGVNDPNNASYAWFGDTDRRANSSDPRNRGYSVRPVCSPAASLPEE